MHNRRTRVLARLVTTMPWITPEGAHRVRAHSCVYVYKHTITGGGAGVVETPGIGSVP